MKVFIVRVMFFGVEKGGNSVKRVPAHKISSKCVSYSALCYRGTIEFMRLNLAWCIDICLSMSYFIYKDTLNLSLSLGKEDNQNA